MAGVIEIGHNGCVATRETIQMLPSQRALFEIPRQICYLNAASYSPLPLRTLEAGRAAVAAGAARSVISLSTFSMTKRGGITPFCSRNLRPSISCPSRPGPALAATE